MDFALRPPTRFAQAERESIDRVRDEHAMIEASELAGPILDANPVPMAVVNELRQVVFTNRAFLEFAGAASVDQLLGLRLGEILGCQHAIEDLSGCGTHPSCRTCGTVNTALAALDGLACVSEVELVVERGGVECALAFELNATPLPLRGRRFVLMGIDRLEPVNGD